MDSIDFNLIKSLHKDARTSAKELAKDVFISSPATSARLEKLKNDEVITGYHAHYNMEKLGFAITAYVLISVNDDNEKYFESFVMKNKNVLFCHSTTGEYTHIMLVSFKRSSDVKRFKHNISEFGKAHLHIITQENKSYSQAQFTDLLFE
ncbi:MAG: Lrp/AsnC family transcriptional regulator [Acutalibacteraceae bacterium]|nr:Lrp/AsnC family transcriptional regulator [Acutalibacteraceae bacterium]